MRDTKSHDVNEHPDIHEHTTGDLEDSCCLTNGNCAARQQNLVEERLKAGNHK